ncbi:MAG: protein-tyrosine phosphatase [Acidimicrobiaceae bacterium]
MVNGKQPGSAAYNRLIAASVDILILCTGNICRSPMAEALLRERLRSRGVEASVSSAGITFDGRAATDDAIRAAAAYDLDITEHRSRLMSAELVHGADLVIGMERLHAREAVVLGDSLLPRCFTLKELVRRGEGVGARRQGESIEAWLSRANAGRRPMELLGESVDDDVADPYLGSPKVYAACIAEIDDLVERLVNLMWPVASEKEGAA